MSKTDVKDVAIEAERTFYPADAQSKIKVAEQAADCERPPD
jgi:hypothetical protein